MARAIRAQDWSATPLGVIDHWPAVLKTTISLILDSRFPHCIVWGPGLVTIPNDAYLPILGRKPAPLGRSFANLWSEAWHEIGPIADRAFAGEATFLENFAMETDRHGEAEEAYFTFCYSPIRDENGAIHGMLNTVTETTQAVRADRQLQTLNKELGHRLKNVLAVTQAVALQTIRRSTSLDHARDGISERLAALGRATDVLTDAAWEVADLASLARATLMAHGLERIRIAGPPVALTSRQAIALALALHELATNAVKYGALANDWGVIDLTWRVDPDPSDESARFFLRWAESFGPVVVPPVTRGFGSTLIERTLKATFKGNVVVEYRPQGLVFTLEAALRHLTDDTGRT